MTENKEAVGGTLRRQAWRFVLLLGIVSLLADTTYEGARSIAGQYLAVLGASATVVGIVAGLGEFVGYGVRLLAGVVADRTRRYWAITLLGYVVNVFAVPALALAGRWEVVAVLLLLERVGKAVRTPSRDAMLSYVAPQVGRGVAFGVHEALDQIGAVLGPLLMAFVLQVGAGYRWGFAVLGLPAVLTLAVLVAAWRFVPQPQSWEGVSERGEGRLPGRFWLYMLFTGTTVVGLPHFALVAYHFKSTGLLSDPAIPIAFGVAMASDAVAALLMGRWFDRLGVRILLAVPVATACSAAAVFASGSVGAWLGMGLWGVVLGIQESVMRAAVAEVAPHARRASAYGIFNVAYGAAWMLGGSAMGWLYDRGGVDALLPIVLVSQVVAVAFLAVVLAAGRPRSPAT
ncbi:MAG: MFS transporter [Candidatus Kapabacteria bacterium]|nr:MFS transporter [Candidatus Kapabacteria bacterium]